MNLSTELLQQWPLLSFMAIVCAGLLKGLQMIYRDQIDDLRKERDKLQNQLEHATSLAEQGQRLALRSPESVRGLEGGGRR